MRTHPKAWVGSMVLFNVRVIDEKQREVVVPAATVARGVRVVKRNAVNVGPSLVLLKTISKKMGTCAIANYRWHEWGNTYAFLPLLATRCSAKRVGRGECSRYYSSDVRTRELMEEAMYFRRSCCYLMLRRVGGHTHVSWESVWECNCTWGMMPQAWMKLKASWI